MTDLAHINATPTHQTEPDTGTLAAWIDNALVNADRQRAELAEAGDLDGLAHGLADLRLAASRLSTFVRLVDGDVSKLNRDRGNNSEIPGLGVLDTRAGTVRTRWESDRLYGRLVDAIAAIAMCDTDTGELTGDPDTAQRMADLLRSTLAACLPITPSMGWRIGGLKAAGIDPNQYRDQERGPDTTRIITPDQGL